MQFVNQSHECCVNEGFNKNFERHALDVVLYVAQTSYFSTNHQHFVMKMANHLPSTHIYICISSKYSEIKRKMFCRHMRLRTYKPLKVHTAF